MEAGFDGVLLEDEIRHRVAAFRAKPTVVNSVTGA